MFAEVSCLLFLPMCYQEGYSTKVSEKQYLLFLRWISTREDPEKLKLLGDFRYLIIGLTSPSGRVEDEEERVLGEATQERKHTHTQK